MLRVTVSAHGQVDHVAVSRSSGYALLDEAAISAVRHWTFTPASLAGKPAVGQVLVPIVFTLSQSGD